MDSSASSQPPKYEPVVQRQPQSFGGGGGGGADGVGFTDAYRAGYDQYSGGGGGGSGGTQLTVMVQSPGTQQPQQMRTWSTTVCGCCEDMASCCLMTWCTPCYVSCSLAPRLGESSCAPCCLTLGGHSVPMVFRTKVRAAQGISGGAIDDCCVANSCHLCVLCQIKRELDYVERCTGRPAF